MDKQQVELTLEFVEGQTARKLTNDLWNNLIIWQRTDNACVAKWREDPSSSEWLYGDFFDRPHAPPTSTYCCVWRRCDNRGTKSRAVDSSGGRSELLVVRRYPIDRPLPIASPQLRYRCVAARRRPPQPMPLGELAPKGTFKAPVSHPWLPTRTATG